MLRPAATGYPGCNLYSVYSLTPLGHTQKGIEDSKTQIPVGQKKDVFTFLQFSVDHLLNKIKTFAHSPAYFLAEEVSEFT